MSTSSDPSSEQSGVEGENAEVQAPEAAETSTGSGTGDQANGRNCEADNRLLEAEAIVHRNTLWAFSAGILPLPIFDVVALSGVQFKMIKELSTLYRLQFTEGMVKKSVTSLLVGVGGVGIGGVLGTSMFKYVPVIGQALGMVSTPVVERIDLVLAGFGEPTTFSYAVARRLVLALAVLGPSMALIGVGLPWVLEATPSPRGVGLLYALDTLGATLGSLLAAWVLLPTINFARTA